MGRFVATLTALALSSCAHQLVPFDAALINAQADAKKPAAEQWEIDTAPEMIPKITAAIDAAAARGKEESGAK